MFQHTAARRRLAHCGCRLSVQQWFQHTAARRRLVFAPSVLVSSVVVSTHSRPKAAGPWYQKRGRLHGFQHTAARRRLGYLNRRTVCESGFQHTAARRRLVIKIYSDGVKAVFQHTAARRRLGPEYTAGRACRAGFNTQPPEGGWSLS